MTEPAPQVALVTGAGRGLGRAIASRLAAAGMAVGVNDIDPDPALATVEAIRRAGGQAIATPGAVDDETAVDAMVAAVVGRFGALDTVVCNAGIASSGRPVAKTPTAEVESLLQVHAVGSFNVVRAALPHLRASSRGRIVMISSVATSGPAPNGAPYAMAKAAQEALAMALAAEERRNGVLVNVICPGTFDTRLGREVTDRIKAANARRPTATPPPPLADPAALADAVLAMLESDATGTRTVVTGL
jgi:3-oxoacyl-[acyl-carrier protein] reductase